MAAGGLLLGQDKANRDMKVLSARPQDLEMQLSGFSDYLTPEEHFFVRTHVYVPAPVEIGEWRLNISGEVSKPLTLSMDDIKKMPAVEMVAVVECAGNGRGLFQPAVGGLQWTNGSVANAKWRGVRLGSVLKQAGIKPTAVEVLFDGADQPIGKMQDFRRSITVKKALDPNTLLAYEMNGGPIPNKHGFPLRVIPAGWASDSWVKWLTSITVLDKEWDGFWMKNAYRKPDHAVAPMTALTPDQMKPVTSLQVKSVIASPLDNTVVKVGTPLTIRGVAWSGDSGPVVAVDVSTDTGRSWRPATLARGQETQFGWRQWEYSWTPEHDAYYTIMVRARDKAGNTQPFAQGWNPSGYGWNVVQKVNVAAGVPAMAAIPAETHQPEPAEFKRTCEVCHGIDVVTQQHLTRGQWDREITKMTNWGAQVKPEDRNSFLDYLFANFGQRP